VKLETTVAAGLVAGAAILATACPSFAAESAGTLAPTAVAAPSPPDSAVRAKLEALVGTQTQAEIQAIIAAGPSEGLFDPETGGTSAAYATEQPSIISSLIIMRGPGCGTPEACLRSGIVPRSFYRTGYLTTFW
jgi:hypothetical protein